MIKSELIHLIASRKPHLYVTDALEQGGRAELRGFGTFFIKHRSARTGRNPKDGEAVSVEEKWTPVFRAGKDIRDRLKGKQP